MAAMAACTCRHVIRIIAAAVLFGGLFASDVVEAQTLSPSTATRQGVYVIRLDRTVIRGLPPGPSFVVVQTHARPSFRPVLSMRRSFRTDFKATAFDPALR